MEYIVIWVCISFTATLIYAIIRYVFNRLDEKNWGPWSPVKNFHYPSKRDPIDGDMLPAWTYSFQDRYHKKTHKYQERRVG